VLFTEGAKVPEGLFPTPLQEGCHSTDDAVGSIPADRVVVDWKEIRLFRRIEMVTNFFSWGHSYDTSYNGSERSDILQLVTSLGIPFFFGNDDVFAWGVDDDLFSPFPVHEMSNDVRTLLVGQFLESYIHSMLVSGI
jgi:hypothetical protein